MCRYLKEGEIKNLGTPEKLEEALKFYEENDTWYFRNANEVRVRGISNLPLFHLRYAGSISGSCPQDAFDECVKSSGLFFEIPVPELNNEKKTYAIRDIGLESAYERGGLSCRLMRTIEDTNILKALSAEQRGILLDTGYAMSAEPIKILVSDDKVTIVGSSKYAILDYRTGLDAAKKEILLQEDFDHLEYETANISHEGLVVEFGLKGPGVDAHKLMLESMLGTTDVSYAFIWSSSHTKMSCMIGRLAVKMNQVLVPIGKAVKIRHMGQADQLMEQFRKNLGRLGASLKENEEQIELLGNTQIHFPKTCLKNALDLCPSIPAAAKKAAIDAMPDVPCTAMDIYLAVNEAVSSITGISVMISAMEEVGQLQYLNFMNLEKERLK